MDAFADLMAASGVGGAAADAPFAAAATAAAPASGAAAGDDALLALSSREQPKAALSVAAGGGSSFRIAAAAAPAPATRPVDARAAAERAREAAASAAERAEAAARFAATSAAAAAAGAPPPCRGPAADSPLGEQLLNVLPLAFAHGHALDLQRMRFLCGLTLRERAVPGGAVATPFGDGVLLRRAADGTRVVRLPWATLHTRDRVDERGFRGATADTIALNAQAAGAAARAARRETERVSDARGFAHDYAHDSADALRCGRRRAARGQADGGRRTAAHAQRETQPCTCSATSGFKCASPSMRREPASASASSKAASTVCCAAERDEEVSRCVERGQLAVVRIAKGALAAS
jgi:hypothetical protein